jgi:hypothetical protein
VQFRSIASDQKARAENLSRMKAEPPNASATPGASTPPLV